MKIPTGMSVWIGLPGAGKTTAVSMMVHKFTKDKHNSGRLCLTNVPILGARRFDITDVGHYLMEDGMIIIDEAGIDLNNRNWKSNLDPDQLRFNKKFRHYNISHYMLFSQYLDMDNTFIRLADSLHLLKRLGPFTLIRDYVPGFNPCGSDGKPCIEWQKKRGIGGIHVFLRFRYYHLFDTYEAEDLPIKEFPLWESVSRFNQLDQNDQSSGSTREWIKEDQVQPPHEAFFLL